MVLGDPRHAHQRTQSIHFELPHRHSANTRPCCSSAQAPSSLSTSLHALKHSTGSEGVDALGRRAVEVIICMITRDFSVISNDVTGVSLSLSLSLPLTKVTDAQYRKRFRASYNQKNVVARVAQPARLSVCWTVDRVTVCNELESAVSSFFGSSSAWSCSTMMLRKTLRRCLLLLVLRQVSGVKMRSVEFKDSLSPSATRKTESKVASSFTCRRRPLQKRRLVRGELDRYCHWPRRRRETAD